MLEETIGEIRAAEEKALRIVEEARRQRDLTLEQANQKAQALLAEVRGQARQEMEKLLAGSIQQVAGESQQIEQRSRQDREELISRTTPKLAEAKKICRS